ncbi:MAG: hypothetical protein ABSG84_16530 [Acidobacteriaceae bacterium]|jgi:hypothetical protein
METPPPSLTLSDRIFRALENAIMLAFLGIFGGLVGSFLDGRYFVVWAPVVPIAIHRGRALEGLVRPAPAVVYSLSTVIAGALLFWCGNSLNHSRAAGTFTPQDLARAVSKVLPEPQVSTQVSTQEVITPPQQTVMLPTPPSQTDTDPLLTDAEKEISNCDEFFRRSELRRASPYGLAASITDDQKRLRDVPKDMAPDRYAIATKQIQDQIAGEERRFGAEEAQLWNGTYADEFGVTYRKLVEATATTKISPSMLNSQMLPAGSFIDIRQRCQDLANNLVPAYRASISTNAHKSKPQ